MVSTKVIPSVIHLTNERLNELNNIMFLDISKAFNASIIFSAELRFVR